MSDELNFVVYNSIDIYKDYVNDMSISEISRKYNISKTRVFKEIADFSKYHIKPKLQRWLELLETDGINSKSMVANDIQYLLEEMVDNE